MLRVLIHNFLVSLSMTPVLLEFAAISVDCHDLKIVFPYNIFTLALCHKIVAETLVDSDMVDR